MFWSQNFQLTSKSWPKQMKALFQMWDDIYWQIFSVEHSDIETLIRAHSADPKLKMFHVGFDQRHSDRNELEPVIFPSPDFGRGIFPSERQ
jgi:hypothetical protein